MKVVKRNKKTSITPDNETKCAVTEGVFRTQRTEHLGQENTLNESGGCQVFCPTDTRLLSVSSLSPPGAQQVVSVRRGMIFLLPERRWEAATQRGPGADGRGFRRPYHPLQLPPVSQRRAQRSLLPVLLGGGLTARLSAPGWGEVGWGFHQELDSAESLLFCSVEGFVSAVLPSVTPGMMAAHSGVEGCGQAVGSRHARSPWKRSVRQDYNLCLVPLGFYQAKNSHCRIRHIKEMAGGWLHTSTNTVKGHEHTQPVPPQRENYKC